MSELPETWSRAPMGDVCVRIVDGSHNPPKAVANGVPMLSARNIDGRAITFNEFRYISESAFAVEHSRTNISPGDVLLTIVGAIGRTAVVPASLSPFALQRSVAVLKPGPAIESRLLAYALEAPEVQKYLQENAKGTAQKGIYLGALAKVELRIPPHNEQKRIVDKLDTLLRNAGACREKLDRLPQILKKFREAVLEAAVSGRLTEEWRGARGDHSVPLQEFGGPDAETFRGYSIPGSWGMAALSEIADVAGGITKDSKKQTGVGEDLAYLRVANVQRGYLDLTEVKTIRVPKDRIESLLLRTGDILFTHQSIM